MTLWLDGESTIESSACHDCGAEYVLVKSFLLAEHGPHAIAFSALHEHHDPEAWIDVIFGSFESEAAQDERVTFGCRVGPVEGSDQPAATAVRAAINHHVYAHLAPRSTRRRWWRRRG